MSTHPMLQDDNRPRIATQPIQFLAEGILLALEDGYRGLQVYGRSGDGKTYAAEYLSTHPQWLPSPAPISWVSMPRRTNASDTVFYNIIQQSMKLAHHPRSSAIDRLAQIVDRIVTECQRTGSRRYLLFIDEAQRLSADDYDFLANIDDAVHLDGYRVFFVFINQSDDARHFRKSVERTLEGMPPQAIRRFFMAEHTFRGLLGVSEFAHALGRYGALEHESVPFPAYFAPAAYEAGWRLGDEAPGFVAALEGLRKQNKLLGAKDLPMAIFEPTVRRLLVRVAPQKGAFRQFAQDDIQAALVASGYLRLEKLRAREVGS